MSNYNYNPIPPRVWSRVQSQCTYIVPGSTYEEAYIPFTGETVPQGQADYEMQMYNKGNILQYKGNSARFTKAQKYSQLARMCGPNRTKVYATQSETYTNPNSRGLLRSGFTTYSYPNQIVGAPNNISGPFAYNIQNPNDCSSNSIQDGGTLVCGTYANPCNGIIIQKGPTTATVCNSASASNVPGSAILCWNNNIQTYFPRKRYFMNNSTNKWPQGYKGFVSAVTPVPPVLTFEIQCSSIILSWKYNYNYCIPISFFNIYENNKIIQTLPYYISTINLDNLEINTNYNFYITSVSNGIESSPSNNVNALINNLSFNLNGTQNLGVITLIWNYVEENNCIVSYYNIYQNGYIIQKLLSNVSLTNVNIEYNNGSGYISYVFYVEAVFINGEKINSNTYTYIVPPLYIISGNYVEYNNNNYAGVVFEYNSLISQSTITFNSNVNSYILVVGGGGEGSQSGGGAFGSGGGGGGIFYTNSYSCNANIEYQISVGNGGIFNGQSSNNTTITSNNLTIMEGTYGSSGTGGNGGQPGSGIFGGTTYNLNGGYGNSGNGGTSPQSNSNIPSIGGTSIQLPFTQSQILLNVSGGGGPSNSATNVGGTAGFGLGGGYSNTPAGVSAVNSISAQGYGGGGGGCITSGDPQYSPGNGGNGVVIFWWQNITF